MRGSIKRGQTPHNSRALTLPASVYAGKRENGKIINVEKVRHRANPCPGRGINTLYSAFLSLKCREMKWERLPCLPRVTPGEVKDRCQLTGANEAKFDLRILVPGCGLPASSIGPGNA
jgi:hypothetical protein